MISFSSALPFLIFLLFNGYFTSPIVDEQLSTSTYLSSNDDSTTAETMNLRWVADTESSTWADANPKRSNDEHMGFEMSTSIADLGEETGPTSRSIEEFSNSESISMTTEQSNSDKRAQDDLFFSTMEPTILTTELPLSEKRGYDDSSSSSWESMTLTTEQVYPKKREDEDLSFTTLEPTTEFTQLNQRDFVNELENGTQEMQVELTSIDMLSLTSTIPTETPELYRSESLSSIPTATEKYIGLLKDDNEQDEEERSTQYTKIQRKSSRNSEDEDLDESTASTAVFDQQALDQVPNVPNDFLMLNESNDLIVTSFSNRIFRPTTTHQNAEEERPLNQGKNSAYTEEKESNN